MSNLHDGLLVALTEGVRSALYERCDDGVQTTDASLLPDGAAPLDGLTYPAVCVTAERSGDVPGGLTLCTSAAGARALAIRSLDPLPPEANDEPLQDGDLEAAREWGAEVSAAVSAASADALGAPFELAAVDARAVATADAAPAMDPDAPVHLRVTLSLHGEPCVALLALPAQDGAAPSDAAAAPAPPAAAEPPAADEPPAAAGATAAETAPEPATDDVDEAAPTAGPAPEAVTDVHGPPAGDGELVEVDLSGALGATRVPIWAELGHARLPLRKAIDLPVGGVIELDCDADAPVDLYVNGLRFAQGQLVITGDGEWALRIDEVDADVAAAW